MDAVTLTRAAAFWIVAALGFSILFPGPASAAGDSAAAAQQRPAASPPSSQASEMDEIAEALKGTGEIRRVQESIILTVSDEDLFVFLERETLCEAGKARLAKIAAPLRAHADNRIYIEEYVPPGQATAKATRRAIAQADLNRNELINQAISVARLIDVLDSKATSGGKSPTKSGRHRFYLRSIPQADEGRADARSLQLLLVFVGGEDELDAPYLSLHDPAPLHDRTHTQNRKKRRHRHEEADVV